MLPDLVFLLSTYLDHPTLWSFSQCCLLFYLHVSEQSWRREELPPIHVRRYRALVFAGRFANEVSDPPYFSLDYVHAKGFLQACYVSKEDFINRWKKHKPHCDIPELTYVRPYCVDINLPWKVNLSLVCNEIVKAGGRVLNRNHYIIPWLRFKVWVDHVTIVNTDFTMYTQDAAMRVFTLLKNARSRPARASKRIIGRRMYYPSTQTTEARFPFEL